ncbi:hypothetical protein BDV38DRAFT_283033 [Aspergillus pseudotamarii]|uniref:S-adenosyl-L-methionine-dependent N-methyltransferase n=1 Tax=Aspergillus pseudotamarii TaxID=132259 RepID=A0A5N6SS80_ASPPS|nr:uncharacterized protein BDV38DRAFT_283033 [Aspergillus pseudotamarii]KAE8137485.1 hypothetical protein BDV38DRAFT_283033 [Aspergillus pseudotamarii]
MTGGTQLVLFGPQLTPTQWTPDFLRRLQLEMQNNPQLEFLRHCLIQLEAFVASTPLPREDVALVSQLGTLAGFARGEAIPDPQRLQGNILLAPLTIVSQVVDWLRMTPSDELIVQGFCIGFLSAAVVSSTHQQDRVEFERYVANSIRLAACIGFLIDREDSLQATADQATAISVRCPSPSHRAALETTIDSFPETYISCITDDRTVTVTLPRRHLARLTERLKHESIPSTVIGLDGCYHHPKHTDAAQTLKDICAKTRELQLPFSEQLHLPLRSTADTELLTMGALHDIAVDLILCKRAHWFQTVKCTLKEVPNGVKFVAVGSESCIPRSLSLARPAADLQDAIAVVGMACRFPQADSLEEFWQLLSAGETTISPLPHNRFNPADLRREPKPSTFWGNFLRHPDVFDHRFFGISGREAKSMDPQQRLALQVAYEAMEAAGYCGLHAKSGRKETQVGCYLGVGAVDYEGNVAGDDANAFSATGTLRAFISGRISHFFGWTGPSITFDTACSSSAVAIHAACKAILAGECAMALAGGVNVITSPNLHQNLAAASFLNPNGSSRAFDAAAGGYCRGEGAGILVLKPLSKAVAANDNILGVIAGSAVNQGSNCSSITVPDSNSQSALYSRALSVGQIDPEDVTYVEAHGTGTQVGDPIEYESIRLALAGPGRKDDILLGSVKDNIGHTEAASGAAGVIKTLLMMQKRTIPKQASFKTLNPRIKASDHIVVPKHTQPWTAARMVALVNNYGAAGSNAAIVVQEYQKPCVAPQPPAVAAYPIVLSAKSAISLQLYMGELKRFVCAANVPLREIAYALSRRQNPAFEYRTAFSTENIAGLTATLDRLNVSKGEAGFTRTSKRPVVLAFGGQTGRTVTVSRDLYDTSLLFRNHLDKCEAVCKYLGLPSILSNIFSGEPVDDIVSLHCMLLSIQVSCAKSWLESGLEVDALIGHSFGQLTALCVADSISLEDAFRLVAGRARLIRDKWGPERGAMLSLECDLGDLRELMARINSTSNCRVDVACYNGPRSFVLSGDMESIDQVQEWCRSFKAVRLQNTHAYHSYVADAILEEFRELAQTIAIQPPRIHIETCSPSTSWTAFTAEAIVEHTRQPVYFHEAVDRLAARAPSAVWLEAGSASPIIAMTRRILTQSDKPPMFIPMELGTTDAMANLANASSQLWTAGLGTSFWPFRGDGDAVQINLPPYQFERTQHWLQYKEASESSLIQRSPRSGSTLVTMVKSSGPKGETLFSIDTSNPVFDLATRGHAVTGHSLCPASMYIEFAAQGASMLASKDNKTHFAPHVESLSISSPLGLGADLFLRLCPVAPGQWDFTITSTSSFEQTEHGKGRISLVSAGDVVAEARLKLLQKIARSSSMDRIMDSPDATGISGGIVYRIFGEIVNYAPYYRGVKSLSSLGNEAVGFVDLPDDTQPFSGQSTFCRPVELDNFLQVAGIHVNCLSTRRAEEVFMCTAVDEVILTPSFVASKTDSQSWTVYSHHEVISKGSLTNNIFVYDSAKKLVAAIMGATFRSVPFKSLARSLTRLNQLIPSTLDKGRDFMEPLADSGYDSNLATPPTEDEDETSLENYFPAEQEVSQNVQRLEVTNDSNTLQQLRALLSNIIEIPLEEIDASSSLEELGIDSLLVTEVLSEIEKRFKLRISPAQFQGCTDVLSVCQLLAPEEKLARTAAPRSLASTNGHTETGSPSTRSGPLSGESENNLAVVSQQCFLDTKSGYDKHSKVTGFAGFFSEPFPMQSELVVQYVVEAFSTLGCILNDMAPGDDIPIIPHIDGQRKLVPQLYMILEDAGLITQSKDGRFERSNTPTSTTPASSLHRSMLARFPKHTSETKLLHTTGHRLADCLSGSADPLSLIFRDSSARALLEDVYTNAPMFKTGTLLLAQYLSSVVSRFGNAREVRILELGAGTGGTTKELVHTLEKLSPDHKFTYTFTDLSSSLVAAARRKFPHSFMRYSVLDVEKVPGAELQGRYDIIISTNCIHATQNLVRSTTHIRQMLRPDGILCLVELTRNLFWFDLVFGLLEGWWLFNDGRKHVLADERRWERCLREAGFNWVDWTDSPSRESDLLRVITASPSSAHDTSTKQETITFKKVDGVDLEADLYYPDQLADSTQRLPVALMIHGGGHVMLSRNDIRPEQTQLLLQHGFLPISVDYRLCPEVTLPNGPMEDVADALHWIRTVLPTLRLRRSDIKIDGARVVSVGWSTGGHLALSLGWNSIPRGIKPPDAILAFYCPLDYEDDFWLQPNIPEGSESATTYELDESIWVAVHEKALTRYNVPPAQRAVAGWMAPSDPRSRLALYMNWHGRTLHVLLRGLDQQRRKEPEMPTPAEVAAVSPLAQVRRGTYTTPTFIIHPRGDDLIPWGQAQRTYEALCKQGVESQLRIVDDVPHLFDMYRTYQKREEVQRVVGEGYKFLRAHV